MVKLGDGIYKEWNGNFYLPDLFIVLLSVPTVTTEGFLMSNQLISLSFLQNKRPNVSCLGHFGNWTWNFQEKISHYSLCFERGFLFLWLRHLPQCITCTISCLLLHQEYFISVRRGKQPAKRWVEGEWLSLSWVTEATQGVWKVFGLWLREEKKIVRPSELTSFHHVAVFEDWTKSAITLF